jgi:glycopeptide antibiotics resistance protein
MEEARLARWLFAAWCLGLLALTLAPFTPREAARAWSTGSRLGTFDFFANIALYLPCGILLPRMGVRHALAIAAGALLSVSIESAQMWIVMRHPSELDVVANALGTALGVAASVRVFNLLKLALGLGPKA